MPEYEFWFRMTYRRLIGDGKITAAVRPGDRRFPHPKGTKEGSTATIRILAKPGSEETGIMPVFDGLRRRVRVDKILVKEISKLTQRELAGCAPDSRDAGSVIYHLGLIYDREFTPSDTVTVYYFTYL